MSDPLGAGCAYNRWHSAAAAVGLIGKEVCMSMHSVADDVTDFC